MATPNIVPRADSEGGLGTSSKYWAAAYIDTITTTSHVNIPDSAELRLGTGNDFRLYHNGSDSYVNNGTGSLYIKSTTSNSDIIFQGSDAGSSITALTLDMSEAGAATFSGNVGIGITSVSKLHVYEDSSVTSTGAGITVEQDGDGDAIVQYLLTGVQRWVSGIDNSDSNKFKIASSSSLGSNDQFTIDISGNATIAGTVTGTSFNGIPFFTDTSNNSMYTHDVSGTDSTAANNTAYGFTALEDITTGDSNVAIGYRAGLNINTGQQNTLVGQDAGRSLTSGLYNVAIGYEALYSEDTHGYNVAIGRRALKSLNAGANAFNVAVGYEAGKVISTGVQNTIVGGLAGDALTTGSYNTAFGYLALSNEDDHGQNVAVGTFALANQNAGANALNVAVGYNAGTSISTGIQNTIMGGFAGDALTTGAENVAIGAYALSTSI